MATPIEFRHEVVSPGSGDTIITKGSKATVHAEGSILNADGSTKKFWSTRDPGQKPFTWNAGLGQVIEGWDQGVLGMKKGEIRKIFIPSSKGYGAGGFPAWGIGPNSNLHFVLECLDIQ